MKKVGERQIQYDLTYKVESEKNPKLIDTENRLVVAREGGEKVVKMGEGGQEVQTSSYMIRPCVLCLGSCLTLCDLMDYSPPGSSVHGDSPGKNTEVGCHALLQGIFPIQGSNWHLLHLPHWQASSLPLAPPGKQVILLVVVI